MHNIATLQQSLEGDLFIDEITTTIYSTDASAYKEKPFAVTRPLNCKDIKKIIKYATENQFSLIPRAAGTSLAGQVVGSGIVVDISKYFTNILEINEIERWIRIQPGVILEEMNQKLAEYNLFFGPETSTANRCTIGGMVGNNACGLHSVIYGSTRDHLISVKTILSDGSEAEFKALTKQEFEAKCKLENLEGKIYKNINKMLSNPKNKKNIKQEFPDKSIPRRNTGYAIDLLLDSQPFSNTDTKFNFAKLIAGSEGTLAFITEIKLNLVNIPPKEKAIICVHFSNLEESFRANLIALKYNPGAVELMDKTILDCTRDNILQNKNRFFIKGDPAAVLMIEFARKTKQEITEIAEKMKAEMLANNFGYHFPIIWNAETKKVWNLRKAGLGVMSNIKGDTKPVSLVEDTAVAVEKLPEYISDFNLILKKYNLNCIYHAHIGTGELHLRPMLNLKKAEDVKLFRTVALETAKLVKKYNGSLSGEHGDGRLRGEFLPIIIGEENFNLIKEIKKTWDENNIFNKGKIVDTPSMNTFLRYKSGQETKNIKTIFDFSKTDGIMRAVEKCNGSGDCRKSEIIGGTMCPSFMATRDERNSTRARANILREFLTNSSYKVPTFPKEEELYRKKRMQDVYEIMDLCLSCKACKSECPSGVDMTKLKAEFLQNYYLENKIPIRTLLIANITKVNKIASKVPSFVNFFYKNAFFSKIMMRTFGFATERKMALLSKKTLSKIYNEKLKIKNEELKTLKTVYLFNDEFTNYNDADIGIKTILLLERLNYKVIIPKHLESGRTYLSKGLLIKAKEIANKNILLLDKLISEKTPLVGIEPSTILTFRDEYPEIVNENLRTSAKNISRYSFTIDEFISQEIDAGNIRPNQFTDKKLDLKFHGHCQQKSIATMDTVKKMLSLPQNYQVTEIPSGCCGMAGSFGFEKEHYEISQKIGELVLFPEIRKTDKKTSIVASGTSCRHQIYEGTSVKARHQVEILYEALTQLNVSSKI